MNFIIILSSLFAYSGYKAIQLNPDSPYLMLLLAIIVFILMIAPTLLSRSKPNMQETMTFSIFNWIGSSLIGFVGTFIMISIPVDIVHIVFALFSKTFLSTQSFQYLFFAALLMSLLGFLEVLRGPKIVKVDIPVISLPEDLQKFKIAQISDLHIGPTIQTRYVQKVINRTNALDPDVVIITGDLVDAHLETIKKHLLPLKNLKAKYGIYYVTGNHEYYWGIHSLLPELEKLGINILSNSNKVLSINNSKILLAGIPDPMAGSLSSAHKPDVQKAIENSVMTDVKILLSHRPDPYQIAESAGFDIQFSGHTHAGQFFPFSLLIPIAHKYYRGLNQYKKLWIYVNPGTGYWGPANRFGIASEITLAMLTSK
jgi:predicted MPP superfamily phosphohydrolase